MKSLYRMEIIDNRLLQPVEKDVFDMVSESLGSPNDDTILYPSHLYFIRLYSCNMDDFFLTINFVASTSSNLMIGDGKKGWLSTRMGSTWRSIYCALARDTSSLWPWQSSNHLSESSLKISSSTHWLGNCKNAPSSNFCTNYSISQSRIFAYLRLLVSKNWNIQNRYSVLFIFLESVCYL